MKAIVIVGFAEALSAPEVVWSLVDSGFSVMAFSRRGRRSALRHSRFAKVFEITAPEQSVTQSISDLRTAVEQVRKNSDVPVSLMPLDDQALWLCGHGDLDRKTVLVGPRGKALELALNKKQQFEAARVAGFAVPASIYVQNPREIAAGAIQFPIVFKPSLASSNDGDKLGRGRGWVCSDRQELESAISEWAGRTPMLLQQFVAGTGEGLFGLATSKGVIAWSGHRRLRMMNPQGSGSSACTVVPHLDPECKAAGERFLSAVEWRGLFMIEMLRDTSGKLWFIEFNGRPWGSMALARRLGLEYPAWSAQLAIDPGSNLDISGVRNHTPVCRHLGREILYLLFVLRGSKSKVSHSWPSIWTALGQVLRQGKNDYWYNWRKDDRKVFASDLVSTLCEQLFKSARSL